MSTASAATASTSATTTRSSATSALGELLSPSYLVNQNAGAGSNWAEGLFFLKGLARILLTPPVL
jgi:hypothetical protein